MQPKAILCKAEASSRAKSENESHQPQPSMALLEDQRVSSIRSCRRILSPNSCFESEATKNIINALIINLSPFSLFSKTGVKDEHLFKVLAQRLCTFPVLATHYVGWSVMTSMLIVCHFVVQHRMPALRPLHSRTVGPRIFSHLPCTPRIFPVPPAFSLHSSS